MGVSQSLQSISPIQMQEYLDCTFFTKKEILHLHEYFMAHTDDHKRMSIERFLRLPVLMANPFSMRLAQVFASSEIVKSDQDGSEIVLRYFTFDDFLDLFSAFSRDATKDVKSYTAFKIYGKNQLNLDFNGDGYIDREDIITLVHLLVGQELKEDEIMTVCKKIMKEVDVDGDNQLSFVEFDQILARSNDFANLFCMRIE